MFKKHKVFFSLPNIVFYILILVIFFTRFYKIPDFFNFGIDEEYQALLSWSIVKNFHILWIGVSASNIGYYLGPGLTYLGAALLWLSKGNPIIFAYFASLIGVLTGVSIYFVVKSIFNKKVALTSFFLYCFSPFAFYYDRRYWPIGVPLVGLWLFFSLIKAFKNPRWLLFTALLMGISYHLHISLWLFWPIIFFVFVYLISKRKIFFSTIIQSMLIFFICTLPLFVFDLIHNFDNLLMPIRLITNAKTRQAVLNPFMRIPQLIQNLAKTCLADSGLLIKYIFFVSFCIFCFFLLFKRKTLEIRILFAIIFLFFLGFIFFPSPMQEYYFVLVLPFVIIVSALFLGLLSWLIYPIILIYCLINTFFIIKKPTLGDYQIKMSVIKKTTAVIKKSPFKLETEGDYLSYGGWRYLFQSSGHTPVQSSADSMFGWIYPDEISQTKPKYKITILRNNNFKINLE